MTQIHTHKPSISHYIILALIILIWGLVWPISKFGLAYINPLWFVTFRIFLSMLIMFPLAALFGKLSWPNRGAWPMIIVIGLFQIGLFLAMLTVGLQYVGAGRSAILVYSTPIWVTPIAYFIFHENISRYKLMALILGIVGILTLFSPWGMDWYNKNIIFGNLLLILSAISWAIAMLCARYMKHHSSSLEMAPWQLLIAFIPVAVLALIFDPKPHIIWHPNLILALGFCTVFGTAFAYWGIVHVGKELPVITTSIALLAVPLISVIVSAILLNEPYTFNNILAMIFIGVGLFFAAWGNKNN